MIDAMKRMWKSLKAKFWNVIDAISPGSSHLPDLHVILAAAEGNVMNTGKRYRKTSDHSPFYSLFTFFGLRS